MQEGCIGRAAQQLDRFLELAALALPPHPPFLPIAPDPATMQQDPRYEDVVREVRAHWTTSGRLSVWMRGRLALTDASADLHPWLLDTRAALALISGRGFHRGRDLPAELERALAESR